MSHRHHEQESQREEEREGGERERERERRERREERGERGRRQRGGVREGNSVDLIDTKREERSRRATSKREQRSKESCISHRPVADPAATYPKVAVAEQLQQLQSSCRDIQRSQLQSHAHRGSEGRERERARARARENMYTRERGAAGVDENKAQERGRGHEAMKRGAQGREKEQDAEHTTREQRFRDSGFGIQVSGFGFGRRVWG